MSYSLADPLPGPVVYFEVKYKDPDGKIPVFINWELIIPSGYQITDASAEAFEYGTDVRSVNPGLVVDTNEFGNTTSTHVISKGLDGAYYDLRITGHTNSGWIYERTVLVCIRER